MSDLEGRVSLVVGAGVPGGIGEACSRALAEAGSKVVLADLPGTQLAEVAGYLEGTVAYHEVDITDEASVEELIAYTVATFGRLDVLDNNAAATALTPLDRDVHSMTTDVWDRTFAVNIRGPMLTCKHAIPIFIDQGAGTIINVSSGQSLRGDDFNPGYSASKAALNALTRSIAVHYGKQNIRCNAVALGVVQTSLMKQVVPKAMADVMRDHVLLPELGEPRDVAEVVTFLASDRSRYITGQVIPVDGGILQQVPMVPSVRHLAEEAQHLQS